MIDDVPKVAELLRLTNSALSKSMLSENLTFMHLKGTQLCYIGYKML